MNKATAVLIVLVVLAAGAYFYFKGGSIPDSASLLQAETGVASAAQIGNDVLALLNQIKSLTIDTRIFESPVYQTLVDYSVQIPPQGVGRANPFAPLPGVRTTPQ